MQNSYLAHNAEFQCDYDNLDSREGWLAILEMQYKMWTCQAQWNVDHIKVKNKRPDNVQCTVLMFLGCSKLRNGNITFLPCGSK